VDWRARDSMLRSDGADRGAPYAFDEFKKNQ